MSENSRRAGFLCSGRAFWQIRITNVLRVLAIGETHDSQNRFLTILLIIKILFISACVSFIFALIEPYPHPFLSFRFVLSFVLIGFVVFLLLLILVLVLLGKA